VLENRVGTFAFLAFLAIVAVFLNWRYWRERATAIPTSDEALMQQIVADLSNLPPHIGDPKAPVVIRVSIDPKHGGPCTKGTVEFIRQLVRDYPGKVQAYFHKVYHDGKAECAAELTINGKKTFTVNLGGKQQTITLHGTARPGDSMSFLIRQIVEQEMAKVGQRREVRNAETKGSSEHETKLGGKISKIDGQKTLMGGVRR
jgi:hypothetical protein